MTDPRPRYRARTGISIGVTDHVDVGELRTVSVGSARVVADGALIPREFTDNPDKQYILDGWLAEGVIALEPNPPAD